MICNLENIDINYEIIGEGKPIVILHGYYIDHTMMVGCMEPAFKDKEGFKRIYIDLPGMGKTKPEESIKTSDDMLEIVIRFIEKIIPNESFMITGLSYGGYLARGVLYKLTNKVKGMLLICPMIAADKEARQLPPHTVLEKDEELLKKIDKEEADDFNSIAVVQNQRTLERYKEEILTGAKLADDKFLTKLSKNGYGFSFDVDDLNIKNALNRSAKQLKLNALERRISESRVRENRMHGLMRRRRREPLTYSTAYFSQLLGAA